MTKTEEFGQYLQNLIESYPSELSIILDHYGIDEDPTPAMLIALYQDHGDQFSSALATLGENVFGSWPDLDHADGKLPLIEKISNTFGSLLHSLTGDSPAAPSSNSNTDTDTKDKPKWTTKKMIVTGIVVVVVLSVIIVVIKSFKKS